MCINALRIWERESDVRVRASSCQRERKSECLHTIGHHFQWVRRTSLRLSLSLSRFAFSWLGRHALFAFLSIYRLLCRLYFVFAVHAFVGIRHVVISSSGVFDNSAQEYGCTHAHAPTRTHAHLRVLKILLDLCVCINFVLIKPNWFIHFLIHTHVRI